MKDGLVTDVVAKVSEKLKAEMAELNLTPDKIKPFLLGLISEQLGVQLKEIQPLIATAVMQQIPKSGIFADDRGQGYNPEVGLRSLSVARLEEIKSHMLFAINGRTARMGINATLLQLGKKPIFTDTIEQDLSIQVGTAGGYLVPTEFHAEVLRKLVKTSTFRSEARWFMGVGMKGEIPRETGTVTITYAGEAVSIPTTDFALGDLTYSLSKRTALTRLNRELYMFSAIDVLTLLSTMFAEQDQLKDDDAFMNGTGKGMPMGLRIERTGMNTTAQAGALLDWTDLTAVKHSLGVAYRNEGGIWIMTNNTIRKVANLKDDSNRPIFMDRGPQGMAGPNIPPMTVGFILGSPVMEDNYIPETLGTASNATEIIYTNLKRGYVGFDSGGAEVMTSDQEGTSFATNKMAVRMLRYDDGKPAIPEAVSFLTGVK